MPLIVDQGTIDSIVESVYKGKPIEVDVEKIADEYDIEGRSGQFVVEPFNALDPEYLTDLLADGEIVEQLGLDNIADLTEKLRLKYALEVIKDLWKNDEGNHAFVCTVEICDSRKRKAFIAYELAGGYMLQFPPVTTIGVFLDEKAIRKVYKDRGYITREDSPKLIKDQLRKYFSWH